jgi:hypothetical protein
VTHRDPGFLQRAAQLGHRDPRPRPGVDRPHERHVPHP